MIGTELAVDDSGATMFARYAHAPNALGYCGPPGEDGMVRKRPERIREAAERFSGAWPYLRVLAEMTGIADPLDRRLVESYWLGGGIAAALDREEFLDRLLAVIGPQAGHYWSHLTSDLRGEAAPNHCFHVFGVYPWSRLLGCGRDAEPLNVLDSCRISWGTVLDSDGVTADVLGRRLTWEGSRLALSGAVVRRVAARAEEYGPLRLNPGDAVAIHWDRVCGLLTPEQAAALDAGTWWQLQVTNRRCVPT